MTILESKKEYNKLLERFNKGEIYFDRKDIPQEEKEKHLKSFQVILNRLSYLLTKIVFYTEDEVLNGFKE